MQNSSPGNSQVTAGSNMILKALLIAGTLDIAIAMIYYYIKNGNNPVNVLNYVAKIALGTSVFSNEISMAISGFIIHFIITFLWTAVFFWLYPSVSLLRQNKIVTAILYGTFIWLVMNLVLIPLRTATFPKLFTQNSIIGAIVLMLAIGLPLSFIIGNYYSKKAAQDL